MNLTEHGVSIEVYDAAFAYQGTVDIVTELSAHRRHLAPSTATIGLDPSVEARDFLVANGAQVVIKVGDTPFMSGWVDSDAGSITPAAPLTYEIVGHDVLMWDVLGWPVPGNTLANQNVAYWKMKAAAETVVKAAVQANAVQRLGLPVSVATDLARGGQIDVSLRFHPPWSASASRWIWSRARGFCWTSMRRPSTPSRGTPSRG
jgi:hypothetical protein